LCANEREDRLLGEADDAGVDVNSSNQSLVGVFPGRVGRAAPEAEEFVEATMIDEAIRRGG